MMGGQMIEINLQEQYESPEFIEPMFFEKEMNGRVHHSIQDSGDGEDTTNNTDNLDKQ